jgi:hypothetical protein
VPSERTGAGGFARRLARRYVRHRFTFLFAALLIAIGGHGLLANVFPFKNPLEFLLAASLVTVVLTAHRGTRRWLLGALAVGSVAARLTHGFVIHPAPLIVSQSLLALVFALATGIAVRRALATGVVNAEHICAALDAYLLAGMAFGIVYWLMETTSPGSFVASGGEPLTPARAIYFSFVTQATLGYGDIAPAREQAQGLVIVQGVGGQMYLAVLVARLVSLYSTERKR